MRGRTRDAPTEASISLEALNSGQRYSRRHRFRTRGVGGPRRRTAGRISLLAQWIVIGLLFLRSFQSVSDFFQQPGNATSISERYGQYPPHAAPLVEILSTIVRSPVGCCFDPSPSHAPRAAHATIRSDAPVDEDDGDSEHEDAGPRASGRSRVGAERPNSRRRGADKARLAPIRRTHQFHLKYRPTSDKALRDWARADFSADPVTMQGFTGPGG